MIEISRRTPADGFLKKHLTGRVPPTPEKNLNPMPGEHYALPGIFFTVIRNIKPNKLPFPLTPERSRRIILHGPLDIKIIHFILIIQTNGKVSSRL